MTERKTHLTQGLRFLTDEWSTGDAGVKPVGSTLATSEVDCAVSCTCGSVVTAPWGGMVTPFCASPEVGEMTHLRHPP